MNELTKEIIDQYYWKEELSIYEVAEKFGTYANKVRRTILKYYPSLRSKSQAQSLALSSGRHKHPTKGTNRSESTKIKISSGVSNKWKEISKEERERRSVLAKERWNNMSEENKQDMLKKAIDAVRKTAKEGSQLEKFLLTNINAAGYNTLFHYETVCDSNKMHLDLFCPELATAIEVDGPSHFFPIWGKESLEHHIIWDGQKNAILIGNGYNIIRLKVLVNTVSQRMQRETLEKIVSELTRIKTNALRKQLIEIEVQ